MKLRAGLVSVAAVIMAAAGVARGQEMASEPFDRAWDMEQSQGVRGKVTAIVEQVYPMDWQTKKLKETPAWGTKMVFEGGKLVSIATVGPDGKERPEVEIKYQNGVRQQVIRSMSFARPNAEPETRKTVETAKIGKDGVVESITVVRGTGETITVPITTEATPEGGKKVSWKIEGPSGMRPGPASGPAASAPAMPRPSMGIVLVFDKSGRLIQRELQRDGKTAFSATLTYNAQGDIETVTMGPASKMQFEREYDAKGNWTKQTRSMVREVQGKEVRDVQEMKKREIVYGG